MTELYQSVRIWPRVRWWIAAGSLLAVLYLLTLTQVHTFDALSYVLSVERKPLAEVLHPHHLAYGPLGQLALGIGIVFGHTGGAALPMQIINALAGAAGVVLLGVVARRATGSTLAGLVAAAGLGLSYAYWYYAVEIEVYTVAALLLICCLERVLAIAQQGTTPLRCGLLGLAHGGAVLFHQTNVLLLLPLLVLALVLPRSTRAHWWRCWGSYAGLLAASVGIPYVTALLIGDLRTAAAALAWLTDYARTGWWGGAPSFDRLGRLALGLSETFLPAFGWLIPLVWLICAVPGLRGRPEPASWFCLAWLLVYGVFFFWWEPENIEFWIAALPPALLLLARALARGPWPVARGGVALAAALVMGASNGIAIAQRGDPASDLQRLVARALASETQPADLLLIPDGLQELYLPYYEQRDNFVSLNEAIFASGGAWPPACVVLQDRIETALHAGVRVLIAAEVLRPPPALLARHRLDTVAVAACFAPYQQLQQPLEFAPPLPGYVRLRTAQEIVRGDGWTFSDASLGWSAGNIAGERFDGGWQFVPLADARILSPLFRIDAADVRAIEIRLAHTLQGRDAQVFFADATGAISEERSLRFTLAETTAETTYRIELADLPAWRGIITRLRIDPVGVGDGGTVRVIAVRVVRIP